MASYSWKGETAQWTTATDWTLTGGAADGGIPIAGDSALILNGGTVLDEPTTARYNVATLTLSGAAAYLGINLTNGTITATGAAGLTMNGSVAGTGTLAIGTGSTLALTGSIAAGQVVSFGSGTGELLSLGATAGGAGGITGFGFGDTIDLVNFVATSAYSLGGVLSVPGSGASAGQTATLTVAGGDGFTYTATFRRRGRRRHRRGGGAHQQPAQCSHPVTSSDRRPGYFP